MKNATQDCVTGEIKAFLRVENTISLLTTGWTPKLLEWVFVIQGPEPTALSPQERRRSSSSAAPLTRSRALASLPPARKEEMVWSLHLPERRMVSVGLSLPLPEEHPTPQKSGPNPKHPKPHQKRGRGRPYHLLSSEKAAVGSEPRIVHMRPSLKGT